MDPQGPRLSSPAERGRSAAKDKGTGGQYVAVCSVSNLPLTHKPFATLSTKVWEVYFSKEVCSFVIIVYFASACMCIWLWLCNSWSCCFLDISNILYIYRRLKGVFRVWIYHFNNWASINCFGRFLLITLFWSSLIFVFNGLWTFVGCSMPNLVCIYIYNW